MEHVVLSVYFLYLSAQAEVEANASTKREPILCPCPYLYAIQVCRCRAIYSNIDDDKRKIAPMPPNNTPVAHRQDIVH